MTLVNRTHSTRRNPLEYDYSIKCVALGDSNVGKTCLLQKAGKLKHAMKTTNTVEGIFQSKFLKINDRKIQLSIWDTAGQETFRSITRIYYRGASCALLVYDVTRRSSFNSLNDWLTELRDHSNNPKIVLVLVANKIDLVEDRVVSREEGERFAQQHRMSYVETSAEKSQNVDRIFDVASQDIYDNIKIGNVIPNSEVNGIKVGRMPSMSSKEGMKIKKKKQCSC